MRIPALVGETYDGQTYHGSTVPLTPPVMDSNDVCSAPLATARHNNLLGAKWQCISDSCWYNGKEIRDKYTKGGAHDLAEFVYVDEKTEWAADAVVSPGVKQKPDGSPFAPVPEGPSPNALSSGGQKDVTLLKQACRKGQRRKHFFVPGSPTPDDDAAAAVKVALGVTGGLDAKELLRVYKVPIDDIAKVIDECGQGVVCASAGDEIARNHQFIKVEGIIIRGRRELVDGELLRGVSVINTLNFNYAISVDNDWFPYVKRILPVLTRMPRELWWSEAQPQSLRGYLHHNGERLRNKGLWPIVEEFEQALFPPTPKRDTPSKQRGGR
ncbi:hypothetical protein WJX72_006905 [[Myrmecia] bisecta]|uniref:Uncharacterized protein n=1 Tax=[Myrmecia] bisecta TaxID=41462 RepID=A0AAW1PX25_9CHLO